MSSQTVSTSASNGATFVSFAADRAGNGSIYNDTGVSLDVRLNPDNAYWTTLANGSRLPFTIVWSCSEIAVRRTDQVATAVTVELVYSLGAEPSSDDVLAAAAADATAQVAALRFDAPFGRLLATGAQIVVIPIGDSNTGGNNTTATRSGKLSWADQLAVRWGGRIRVPVNAGVSGERSDQILSRFATDVVAKAPQATFIVCGTNDQIAAGWGTTYTVATVLANIQEMVRLAREAGIVPVVGTIMPNNNYPTRPPLLNAAIKAWAAIDGVECWDNWSAVANQATGNYAAGMNYDALHTSEQGAQAVADYVRGLYPSLPSARAIRIATASTDSRSKIANPLLADSNADGVPDSWTKVTNNAAVSWAVTPGAVGNTLRMTTTSETAYPLGYVPITASIGDKIALAVRIKTVTTSGTLNPLIRVTFDNADQSLNLIPMYEAHRDNDGYYYIEGTVPAATTLSKLEVGILGGAGYVEVSQPSAFIIA